MTDGNVLSIRRCHVYSDKDSDDDDDGYYISPQYHNISGRRVVTLFDLRWETTEL